MPGVIRDLRLAARRLARAPSMLVIVLATVGVGTGANAVVVSAARTLLFEPPPGVVDAGRLVRVLSIDPRGGYRGLMPDEAARLDQAGPVRGVIALRDRGRALLDVGSHLADVPVVGISSGGFDTLGLSPAAGRLFEPGDDVAGVAVISHALWAGAAGSTSELDVGDRIDVLGATREIVGILPRHFTGLRFGNSVGIWTPMVRGAAVAGDARVTVVARLDDVTDESRAAIGDRLMATPEVGEVSVVPFSRLGPDVRPRVIRIAIVLIGATALVLLVACVNAGAMMLSRGMTRARELAIRQAIGASAKHLVRELLAESVWLAVGAAAVGLLFCWWASSIVPSLLGVERDAMPTDPLTVLASIVISLVVAGGLLSVGPLLQGLRPADLSLLRGDGTRVAMGQHGFSTRAALVVTQIALSSVLLVLSLVLMGTLREALWAAPTPPVRDSAAFVVRSGGSQSILESLTASAVDTGLVRNVGWASTLPLGHPTTMEFLVPGSDGAAESREIAINVVSENYFDLVGLRLLDGRPFGPLDTRLSRPVVVVDDVMARMFFDGSAVGRQLPTRGRRDALEIVGVVASRRFRTLEGPSVPMVYFPYRQRSEDRVGIVAPVLGRPDAAARTIADAWRGSGQRIESVSTMETRLSSSLPADRVAQSLLRAATMMAMLLITVGVYGVMADTVARRRREIGVCAALGAGPSRIVGLVMSGGLRLAGVGVVSGLVIGLGAWQLLNAVLEGTGRLEIDAIATTVGTVLVMTTAAALVPAARALRVNPMVVMRQE